MSGPSRPWWSPITYVWWTLRWLLAALLALLLVSSALRGEWFSAVLLAS